MNTRLRCRCSATGRAVTVLITGLLLLAWGIAHGAGNGVEKVLFLVIEDNEIVASNTLAGSFERLELHAKERIEDYKVANAVAVVATNQRFVAYGVVSGGWQTLRTRAGEKLHSIEVADYSATVVTNDRILNFYGRNGTWAETRRGVK